jgi:hypothetical protein
MKQLRKFFGLTSSDRLLLFKAVFLLGAIRVGLKLLPFQQLRGLLAKISQPNTKLQAADEADVRKVAWAVTVASPHLQETKCLLQLRRYR